MYTSEMFCSPLFYDRSLGWSGDFCHRIRRKTITLTQHTNNFSYTSHIVIDYSIITVSRISAKAIGMKLERKKNGF